MKRKSPDICCECFFFEKVEGCIGFCRYEELIVEEKEYACNNFVSTKKKNHRGTS